MPSLYTIVSPSVLLISQQVLLYIQLIYTVSWNTNATKLPYTPWHRNHRVLSCQSWQPDTWWAPKMAYLQSDTFLPFLSLFCDYLLYVTYE